MKTLQEVEKLKYDWSLDPNWDIEETEGFEEHKKDLLIFRLTVENKRMRKKLSEIDDAIYEFKRIFKF